MRRVLQILLPFCIVIAGAFGVVLFAYITSTCGFGWLVFFLGGVSCLFALHLHHIESRPNFAHFTMSLVAFLLNVGFIWIWGEKGLVPFITYLTLQAIQVVKTSLLARFLSITGIATMGHTIATFSQQLVKTSALSAIMAGIGGALFLALYLDSSLPPSATFSSTLKALLKVNDFKPKKPDSPDPHTVVNK